MQEPSSKNKKGLYRLRRADPHERLSARLRHFSFGAAVVFVVAAAGIVIHSLYNIQIKNGATAVKDTFSDSYSSAPASKAAGK
jgi:stage V sporulation protein D (sporulation-specific penicillin-binding protein)